MSSPVAAAGAPAAGGIVDVLSVDAVSKRFARGLGPHRRHVQVLDRASMRVGVGEMVGLVGENGSGKSTLMQIIVGLLGRDGGEFARRGRLGYCPQQPLVWDKLTVDEHFELFARAYELDDRTARRVARRRCWTSSASRYRGYRVEELSGGTRQKLNLALALMHEPAAAAAGRALRRL